MLEVSIKARLKVNHTCGRGSTIKVALESTNVYVVGSVTSAFTLETLEELS